jgi:hypothetical protein
MKQVLVLAIGELCARVAEAQTVGIKVVVNIWNNIKTHDTNFETDFKSDLNAGLFVDIPADKGLDFSPKLMLSQKEYITIGASSLGIANEYSVTSKLFN